MSHRVHLHWPSIRRKWAAAAAIAVLALLVALGPSIAAARAAAPWQFQNPLPTGNGLGAADFVDASHGWAVGAHGSIVATTDGGAHWNLQTSATSSDLRSVCFVDAIHGWAVGIAGAIETPWEGIVVIMEISYTDNFKLVVIEPSTKADVGA